MVNLQKDLTRSFWLAQAEERQELAQAQAEPVECIGHLAGTAGDFAPAAAVDITLDPARNDFARAVVALGVNDQRRNQQRLALHLTQHGGISL